MQTPPVCNSSHVEAMVRDLTTPYPPSAAAHAAQDVASCKEIYFIKVWMENWCSLSCFSGI